MQRILICGDRNYANFNKIEKYILTLPKDTTIVEGDCRGTDRISGYLARKHGLTDEKHPANWDKYGLSAGPLRNQEMIDSKINIVTVFHEHLEDSKGTADTIRRAKTANIPILINP